MAGAVRQWRRLTGLIWLLLVGLPNVAVATAPNAFPAPVAKMLAQHAIPQSKVSLVVRELDNPDNPEVLTIKPRTSRNPASAIKLLTTMAGLEILGPHYEWQTTYLIDGKLGDDGVLNGDLILHGSGDPFLTVEHLFRHVLQLRQNGLRVIDGDLVIDNSHFATKKHRRDAFDEMPERLYNVGPDAALVNFSASTFHIHPETTPNGERVRVYLEPPLAGVSVVNRLQPEAGACVSPLIGWNYRSKRHGENIVVTFDGNYRSDCGAYFVARSILPNPEYAYRLFAQIWRGYGGELRGNWRVGRTPKTARVFVAQFSPSLADIITSINKFSNNVMSRQLLLSIAAHQPQPQQPLQPRQHPQQRQIQKPDPNRKPATVAQGIRKIKKWMKQNRLPLRPLRMENGAGLSRKSRMSADGLSQLLDYAWRSTYRPEFLSSLPLAAMDGNLRSRQGQTPVRGRARIKTGLLDYVRTMAGYVHAQDGRHYSVVLLIQSKKINFNNGNDIQDALLEWVYLR